MERDYGHDIERLTNDIRSLDTADANKEYVRQFVSYLQAKGSAPNTIIKHLYCAKAFFSVLDPKADLKDATREQIQDALGKLEVKHYSPETKHHFRVTVKLMSKQLFGEGLYYPKNVAWIKNKKTRSKVTFSDILTEDDIQKMLDATANIRDRAIIALLFDSGIRIGEMLSLRKRDVDLEGNPAHVSVNGKTGLRTVGILFSAPYLAQYLNTLKLKEDDFLWRDIGSWSNLDKNPTASAIRKMLREVAVRAGIEKRIYPHLFRHSRATLYAKRMTEQEMKVYFGWSGSSTMAGTYTHLSARDADNAVLRANGIVVQQGSDELKLKNKQCPRCRYGNAVTAEYCSRCGSVLDVVFAKEAEQHIRNGEDALEAVLQSDDPKKLKEVLSRILLRLDYEEKRKKR